LIERDLCWQPGIANTSGFLEFVREVKNHCGIAQNIRLGR
jgi:hypothetical protein